MPSLSKTDLDSFFLRAQLQLETFQIFLETGTYRGETIFAMEPYFKQLHTIEIKKEFYDACKEKYHGNKIQFHLGDSSKVLPKILPEVQGNMVLFLDGHWSSKDTGKGDKDVPLFEELDAINSFFKSNALIIIDDYRLFGRSPNAIFRFNYSQEDWSAISKSRLISRLKPRVSTSFVAGDRFIIGIKNQA